MRVCEGKFIEMMNVGDAKIEWTEQDDLRG